MSFIPDNTNPTFQLAADLVNLSSSNIFLTGKAGTGKTTFLKYIRKNCHKQMAVVAPTGVAAINAGGATIHSFFQLPLSPFVPAIRSNPFSQNDGTVNKHSLISRMKVNNDKRKIWQKLDLLIIDEVSMVRCDILDAIDTVLRHFRNRPHEKFGGVQVLLIGDMFQLPPVVRDQEWNFLHEFYDSPYFFSSHAIKSDPPLYIEFDKIYRQSEERFIGLLNQVRNNDLNADANALLDSRFQPAFRRSKDDGYIILTTHNERARNINLAALQELKGEMFKFESAVKNEFPETAFPADEILYLKIGAQVMFIRNDVADRGKRYFNGKIGTVTKLEKDKVYVRCEGESAEIDVLKEKWDNIRYSLDRASQKLKEEVLGTFEQYPLKLAWAITIHKSQGLTFDKAIIDAGEAFAPGQVYVALSRCTNLDGLILQSRIRAGALLTDPRIIQFSQSSAGAVELKAKLEKATADYQQKIILQSFDLTDIVNQQDELINYCNEHRSSFSNETIPWLTTLRSKTGALNLISQQFQNWLRNQFLLPTVNHSAINERIPKAALHFTAELKDILGLLSTSPSNTDSITHATSYNNSLKEIYTGLMFTRHMMHLFSHEFDVVNWHKHKNKFILPAFDIDAYSGNSSYRSKSPHPFLYQQLKELRNSICEEKELPVYRVLSSNGLEQMAEYLPQTLEELESIAGFGKIKINQYGQRFLDLILSYCESRGLGSSIHLAPVKKLRSTRTGGSLKKGLTHEESFRLFKEGKSPALIAKERNLTVTTIEGHLAKFVRQGDINIDELVTKEKFELIESALKTYDGNSIRPIKDKLGEAVSYGEIYLVMAGLGLGQKQTENPTIE